MITYDSTLDTLKHKAKVSQLMSAFGMLLVIRGIEHDDSKLKEFEKSAFDRVGPNLGDLEYGSEEYKASLENLKEGLAHHYAENSHHPEHYPNGIDDMDLLDIVEMFIDWLAATERTKDGDIMKSLEINKERFSISDQLCNIFKNTALGMDRLEI